MQDLLRYAIKEADALGVTDSEAYGVANAESEVFIENNDIKQAKSQKTSSIGIRVLVNGSTGFYSVNSMTKSKINNAVSMAVKIARLSPKDKYHALPGRSKGRLLTGIYDKTAGSFDSSDATRLAVQMLEAAKSYDSRVSVDSGNFSADAAMHALENSNGTELSERVSIFSWSIMGMAISGSDISNFDFQLGGSHSVKGIDVHTTATEFAETVVNSLGPKRIECFKGEMILTPAAFNEMMEEVISHSISSDAVQKMSSNFAGKIDKKVSSDLLTIEDDATNVEGLGAASFDREGVRHHKNVVIEKGVLKKFLYNTYTARKEGVRSTGNASGSSSSPPSVSTTNFVVKPGRSSLSTLISETKNGIIVSRFSGNVNPVNGDFSGVVKGGRRVKNGKIEHPVKEVMVAGNVFEALRKLNGVSKERKIIHDSILPYMRFDGIPFTAG